MKAAYALGFLGLCAVVLVLHVYDTPEETREVQDPFLASLEAHVVAKAQRRLRQRDAQDASETHISEARKAMKAALLDAHSSSLHEMRQAEEEVQVAATTKKATKKVAKEAAPAGAKGKVYTWAELQRGDDAKKETFTDNKVGNLMGNLQSAPKADKTREGTTVLAEDAPEDTSNNALSAGLSKVLPEDDDDEDSADEEKPAEAPKEDSKVEAKDTAVPEEQEDQEEEADGEESFEDDEKFEDRR